MATKRNKLALDRPLLSCGVERGPVIAIHVVTGETKEFPDLKECWEVLGAELGRYELYMDYAVPENKRAQVPVRRLFGESQGPETIGLGELRLIADHHSWAVEDVKRACGTTLSRFHICELAGYGAETLVFRAEDRDGMPYAIKAPWDPQSRCMSVSAMARKRQRVEHEARILRQYQIACFPAFIELVYYEPIFSAGNRPPTTPYLVEEWIDGIPLVVCSVRCCWAKD